jgi:hypothetical protein
MQFMHKFDHITPMLHDLKWLPVDRYFRLIHSKFRLGFHGLKLMNICLKLIIFLRLFSHCGMSNANESVQHYFLHCPGFAAQRNLFLASAVWICGQSWSESSDGIKTFYILTVMVLNIQVILIIVISLEKFINIFSPQIYRCIMCYFCGIIYYFVMS